MDDDSTIDASSADHSVLNLQSIRCSETKCYDFSNQNTLQCSTCERLVHYRCTRLPAYQIQLFISTSKANTRSGKSFCCFNCVEVSADLPALCQPIDDNIEDLKKGIAERDRVIEMFEENEQQLYKAVKSLKSRNAKLKDRILERKEVSDAIQEKMTELGAEIKTTVIEQIKDSLLKVENQVSEVKQSYAEAARDPSQGDQTLQPQSIKVVIKEALREEEAKENDKQRRSRNVIVHGVVEKETNEDKLWVEQLLKDTHANVTVKRITRLGKPNEDKKRPILICLSEESEKLKLLGNLPTLKGNQKYSRVSITEDLTPDERKQLRKLSSEAKELNAEENSSTDMWRVRGNSKNGFFLKKVPFKLTPPNPTHQTAKKATSKSNNQ